MANQEYDIRSVFDMGLWEKIQDQLAKLTGTSVIVVDNTGVPVSRNSGQSNFCAAVRQSPVMRKRCLRCDALGGLEAMRLGRPYIYLCHCGVVEAAVPVRMDNNYLGAVLFGQVRVPNDDSEPKLERLVNEINSFSPEDESGCRALMDMYNELPEMSYSKVESIAELISSIVNYIVQRVIHTLNEKKNYEWILNFSDTQPVGAEHGIQELVVPAESDEQDNFPVGKSSAIYPALVYIKNHLYESITMKDMATLCHLSPSYFSRLFGREMGENFVSYVNRKKVQLAKSILRETNKSVSQIASELNYKDSSHFINLFKRFEGITPQVYRQYNYR